MTARALPLAVLAGLLAAMMLASVLLDPTGIGGLILRSMAALPLFAVGLSLGIPAAGVAAVVGIGASWALGPPLGIGFAIGTALPVMVVVPLALRPPAPPLGGRMVVGLTVVGLVAFVLLDLAFLGQPDGLEGAIAAALSEGFLQVAARMPELDVTQFGTPEHWAFWLTGALTSCWLLVIAINGVLAQGALARFHRNLVPAPEMAAISVPRVTSVAFVAAAVAAWLGTGEVAFIGVNLAEILAVPLVFGGLGVLHALAARHPARQMILTMLYVVVLGIGLPIALIVVLGMIEQWAGLRRRFAAVPRRGDR
jgi:hypothetical protein